MRIVAWLKELGKTGRLDKGALHDALDQLLDGHPSEAPENERMFQRLYKDTMYAYGELKKNKDRKIMQAAKYRELALLGRDMALFIPDAEVILSQREYLKLAGLCRQYDRLVVSESVTYVDQNTAFLPFAEIRDTLYAPRASRNWTW